MSITDEYPDIIVDDNGYLRIRLKSGELLPETDLKIKNQAVLKTDNNICEVTVTFMAKHRLKIDET